MADLKPWLWRNKSSEKMGIASEKEYHPSNSNEEEVHILLSEKAELERDLKDMSDKLSFAISECNATSDLANGNAKMAQDALTGWEKAEAKALALKEELEKALERGGAYEERAVQLDAALKECMQQLRFVRDEKEERIDDVVSKLAKDYDEKIAELQCEISRLREIVYLKEKLTDELNRKVADTNAEFRELSTRLDSTEKHNISLKYEVQVLEKELHTRNEERDFNRQKSNAAHKLHLEAMKKIAKLDSECQRLRSLVRKRLPGPASVTRINNEADLLLKLHSLESENNALKENLRNKTDALQTSRDMYAQTALKLKQVEARLDFGCDDKVSCAWSSASTMISELTEKGVCARSPRSNPRSSEISLMDDFLEMEKLAVASTSGYHGAIPLLHIQTNLKDEIGKLKEKISELEEKHKGKDLENEDLSSRLSVAKMHLEDVREKLSACQAESEYKTRRCEELEASCNELKIQLQSATKMDVEQVLSDEDEKFPQASGDVTAASENIKAMPNCRETTSEEKTRADNETTEMACSTPEPMKPPPGFLKGSMNPMFESEWNAQGFRDAGFGALTSVAIKKKRESSGLLKRLVWRKREGKLNRLALALSTC